MIESVGSEQNLNLKIERTGRETPQSSPSSEVKLDTGNKNQQVGQSQSVAKEVENNLEQTRRSETSLEKSYSQKQIEKSIQRLNDKLGLVNRELQIKMDEKINRNYFSIIDKKTDKVIREYPPEEIRSFVARVMELEQKMNPDTELMNLIINLEA